MPKALLKPESKIRVPNIIVNQKSSKKKSKPNVGHQKFEDWRVSPNLLLQTQHSKMNLITIGANPKGKKRKDQPVFPEMKHISDRTQDGHGTLKPY